MSVINLQASDWQTSGLHTSKQNLFSDNKLNQIADGLSQTGCVVLTDSLKLPLLQSLQLRVIDLSANQWKVAGIGRQAKFQVNEDIRNDYIAWLTASNEVESAYLRVMESLRVGINQRLYLGLFDYE